jgi:regulator of protease activity HflC (stomatin/prohibitin superfamily)
MVNYRVIDPVKAAYETANHDTQLETEASAVISEAVMARTWAQCLNERRQLQEEVHRTLTREMHRFGVEILKTSLNDLTYQRVIRLVQNREAYDAYEEG